MNISQSDIRRKYDKKVKRKLLFIPISIIVTIILMAVFTGVGAVDVSLKEILSAIKNIITNNSVNMEQKVIVFLRLPRIILSVLAGMGLAVSGTIMQGITKNPMASPFTIGISSAAACGASIAMIFGISLFSNSNLGIISNAFIFAILCAIFVYSISIKLGMKPEAIILSGIAINYLFSAVTSTIHFYADDHQLASAVQWTFGSINGAKWSHVLLLGVILSVSLCVFMRHSWILNAMVSGGDEMAKTLGINPDKSRTVVGVFSVFLTAAIVSFTGVIGFVGLVAPHIARLMVGGDHRFLIPYSAIFGGILLLVSDTIGRTLLAPINIPVGIVVSYLGVPLFIHLIIQNRKEYF